MNISKPISTASRLRATFTSSAAPERAGKPIHATLSLDPGLHRRLKLAVFSYIIVLTIFGIVLSLFNKI